MGDVYTDYFQKSKVFIYPLLKIKKGMAYVPSETYIAWEHVYSPKECRILCVYNTKYTDKFHKYSVNYLERHPLYQEHVELEIKKQLYIFDFTPLKEDWNRFLEGKFSQFSLGSKINILDFFGDTGSGDYIKGFLSPEDVHEDYADALGVDLNTLKEVNEVCSKPDVEKETLIDNNYFLYQLLKKSSISLVK